MRDSDKKEKSWWNPMSYLGSSKDSSTQPSSAAAARTSSGPSALATAAGQPAAEKQETSWWNPAHYLPTFGSK